MDIEIYVITLKNSKRIEEFDKNMKGKSTYKIFYGIDGRKINIDNYMDDISFLCKYFCPKGVIGCGLSHINLWRKIVKEGDPNKYYIIMEDDGILNMDLLKKYFDSVKTFIDDKNHDILFLSGGSYDLYSNVIYNDNKIKIYSPKMITGTHCYIIKQDGAKRMLNKIGKIYYHIDFQISSQKISKGIIKPELGTTIEGNKSTMVNHNKKFLLKFLLNQNQYNIYYGLTFPVFKIINFDVNFYAIILFVILLIKLIFFKKYTCFLFIFLFTILLTDLI